MLASVRGRQALTCSVACLVLIGAPNAEASPVAALDVHDVDSYRHPVLALVIDFFDADAGKYGAGNRGLDYLVFPGQAVRAAGDGVVVFAGLVAGERYVTVVHPDGLRSSYSYLGRIDVARGARVQAGELLGITTHRFQLGFRSGDTYIDPYPLLSRDMTARLVEVVVG